MLSFIGGGGEMGARIRAHPWASTPLGAPETWPQSLRSALSICLHSSFPTAIYWGPDLRLLYNDAWAPIPADRHPWALGRPAAEVWADIWAVVGPQFAQVVETGEGFSTYDQMLPMQRHGRLQQTYWNYSFTPIRGEDGRIVGVFNQGHETTERVRTERRQAFRLALEARLRALDQPGDVMAAAVELLGRHLGANRVGYGDVQADDVTVVLHSCYVDGAAALDGRFRLDSFGSGSIARQRRGLTQTSADVMADPDQDPAVWAALDTRAFASVPLLRDGRFAASLYVNFREPHVWTPDEISLVEEVAARTWAEVERARASAALQESEARLRFLSELDEALRRSSDAPAAMAAATGLLARKLGASRCAYADVDTDLENDRFVIRSDYAAPGLSSSVGVYSLDLFGPRAAADMRGGRTLVIRDVPGELAPDEGREMFQAIGIDAIVCCPLVKQGRLVAMMAVHQDRPRNWRADEIGLVEAAVERCWAHVARVGAEARLRESEARYRTLFEAIEVGFCIIELKFDDDGRAIDYRLAEINPAFERQTGLYGAAGKWVSEAVPGLEPHWYETYGRVARTGEPVRFEDFAGPFGRWYDVYAFRTGEPAEHRVGILFNDITQRRRAEAELRELNAMLEQRVAERTSERQLLAKIVEITHEQIQALDLDYRWLAINPSCADAYERLYGRRPKVGDSLPELLADRPEHLAAAKTVWARALAGEAYAMTADWGDPTLGRRSYEMRFEILRDAEGRQIGAFLTGRDITERLEEQKRLEQAEEALRQSQKMEAIGQLTGGVAHDFNNLLTPIVGSLDMLQRRELGGERERRLIAGAMQSADRAKTLVQRLLAFARRQPLQPVAVDIAGLVAGMGDLVASTTGPQIKVVVEALDDLPPAKADPNQLEMALLNLSVNARDAMPDGGTLRISARAESVEPGHRSKLRPGSYVCLSVADTGHGMDEATLARAVEPFFSTKGVGKGTGLGLSMVHGLASQLGGALTIQSRPGLGTNVELWLPQSAATPEPAEPRAEMSAVGVRGTALVVDDEELVRLSTADMLNDIGYAVTEAASAEEAMRLLGRGERFDLLVTDHLMPGMNGTELARAVRSLRPGVPVLLVSGYAEYEGIDPDLPRLTKPFRKDELAASLAQLSPPSPGEASSGPNSRH